MITPIKKEEGHFYNCTMGNCKKSARYVLNEGRHDRKYLCAFHARQHAERHNLDVPKLPERQKGWATR